MSVSYVWYLTLSSTMGMQPFKEQSSCLKLCWLLYSTAEVDLFGSDDESLNIKKSGNDYRCISQGKDMLC